MANAFSEKTTVSVGCTFLTETGAAVNLGALDVCRGSVHNENNEVIRSSDSLIGNPDVSLPSNGKFLWYLTPYDTEMPPASEFGSSEGRTAYVRLAWASESNELLTGPMATTNNSREVVITHPSHGLSVRDAVFLEAASDVGGLDFDSCWVVSEVINANSYKIQHHRLATSTASGGGSVRVWKKCRSAVAKIPFQVLRDDPH